MNSIKSPNVSIIILNWNGWEDTIECLESIYQSNYSNYNIIIVDNDSKDDSIKRIKNYCEGRIKVESDFFTYDEKNKPINVLICEEDEIKYSNLKNHQFKLLTKGLTIIKNKKNYGFAKGNNIGIQYAVNTQIPDYVFLLNNDTVIDENSLVNLVKKGESSEKIGVLGPTIYYYQSNGQNNLIESTGGKLIKKFPGYYPININVIDGNIKCDEDVDWISGAAMMLKFKNIDVNYLNTEFFFGCEDVDLCIKLKKEGLRIVVAPKAKIWHKMAKSRNKKYRNMEKSFYNILSGQTQGVKTNLKFLKKHNKYFYWFLPIYAPTIMREYLYYILMKFKFNIKRKN